MDLQGLFKEARESLKSPSVWALLFLVAFVGLAIPESIAQFLGLSGIRVSYRWVLGAALIIGLCGLVISAAPLIEARIAKVKRARLIKDLLKTLSPAEKKVFAQYIEKQTKTLKFSVSDGVAMGLVSQELLYLPTEVPVSGHRYAFNVRPWVWNELNRNPDLLKTAGAPASPGSAGP